MGSKRRKARQPVSPEQQDRLRRAVQAHSTGQLAVAEAEYRALIAANVRLPELYCNLARICAETARRDEADELWRQALEIDPRFLEAQMNLADSCREAGDVEQAGKIYRRVLADHGGIFVARYLLGNILKSQGKLDEASACYERVMRQQPGYTQAHFSYSGIHKYRDRSDPHLRAMLDLYRQDGLGRDNRIHLAFALAKAFEDIGDYAEAFGYLKAGNDLRFEEYEYDIRSDAALIESIMRAFTGEAISRYQVGAETSRRPIFIVGMPRSGTTLVEKILASHTDVYGAGELDYLFALGTSLFLSPQSNFEFQCLDSYDRNLFATVGTTYLDRLRRLNDRADRVTDKMPFNMMMIGLIRIALPHAKIIHCVRDARDTCLSIYKQNFTTGNYRFAYDLKTVAQFHNQYRKLMHHWHAALPGVIYDIRYESLTRDPDNEIRKLLSYCDLEFQESCLNFDKSKGVVTTASAYQVRQPMYTSSVGLWKKYEPFLGPMLAEIVLDE